MKALVTGCAGFIGSHICEHLVENNYEVIGVDDLSTGDITRVPVEVDLRVIDVCDADDIVRGVDVIFHTAAVARTLTTVEKPIYSNKTNVEGTLTMLEAARKYGVKRFVHSSSCILYVPTTPYYVGKLAAEEYVRIYNGLHGVSTVSLRYANVYGKHQSEKGAYPNVLASFRKDKREKGYVTITGTGEQTRDYIHVHDVVRANMLAARSTENGHYDIGTGVQTSLNELAPYYDCKITYTDERVGDVLRLEVDTDNAWTKLGFEARIPISEGIKEMV